MNLRLIDLSKNRTKGVNTIEATFMVDGELVPLRVSEEDRPAAYREIIDVLEAPNPDSYDCIYYFAYNRQHIQDTNYKVENLLVEVSFLMLLVIDSCQLLF